MDSFIQVKTKTVKVLNSHGLKEIVLMVYPTFSAKGTDIMKKGGKFCAIFDKETGFWSYNEQLVYRIIDRTLYSKAESIGKQDGYGILRTDDGLRIVVNVITNSETKVYLEYHTWFTKLPDNYNFRPLDETLTFQGDEVTQDMYRTKTLSYKIEEGDISAYDKLMSTLYSKENRAMIEWCVGSIFAGDSKYIEKLLVLYGDPGTGKSTVLDIIKWLFEGYYTIFVASDLASKTDSFSTTPFKDNPLVAIQDDGSLKKIDSPVINEIISHKEILINEKNKARYKIKSHAMLFMATNETVDIHDTKLGIARRLLDVYPTGNKLPVSEYRKLYSECRFELGAIAHHCLNLYKSMGKEYYEGYKPKEMIRKTNDLQNFIFDNYDLFVENDPVQRDILYKWYKSYCEDSGVHYIPKKIIFSEQMKEYYSDFFDVKRVGDKVYRNVFQGFLKDKLSYIHKPEEPIFEVPDWLQLKEQPSKFDKLYSECFAQYANTDGTPSSKWERVVTRLSGITTSVLHYVKVPLELICIDFDIKDLNGNKDIQKNLEAASHFPRTYAELSKSGTALHLYYIYKGDPTELVSIYDKDIEIKVFKGGASLRRLLTKCNDLDVAIISSGLPKKGEQVVNYETISSERHLRALIVKALKKDVFPYTKPSMDFIKKITDEAYSSKVHYDITDMRPDIQVFANNSSHQAPYCLKVLNDIKWCSEDISQSGSYGPNSTIVFFDVEIFKNLFVLCWKEEGSDKKVISWINPKAQDIEDLCKHKLVGFNNRNYDNHILYARMMGYTVPQLYDLSCRIIKENGMNAKFLEAYKLSYTDIYDYAAKKQSLKKWEIELDIHHQELGVPWDEEVPEEMWNKVASYCQNDVIATEAVWNATKPDFLARQILADISGLDVNATTNQCTTKLIVGDDPRPQDKFEYTDLSTIFSGYEFNPMGIDKSRYNPGSKIVSGKSLYMGEDPGEGGYVFANPGMHKNVVVLDVASMHPHSAIRLNIFGDEYTRIFEELVESRVFIKHKDYDSASRLLGGKLAPYLKDKDAAKQLAQALKIAINSVYGLTSAKFDNKLRDPRNVDNIVAKYGALFMITLKHEVIKRGYTVVHIKTDSIKIAEADNDIIDFVNNFGKHFGYTFEHEATYEKICLVNESTYIAKYQNSEWCKNRYGYIPGDNNDHSEMWTATGAQFQVPYVFKTLFSKETIEFCDICETKSVTTALYLDLNENLPKDEHNYIFVGRVGRFTPVLPGFGGGILLRENNGKFNAATGTKKKGKKNEVYLWMESEYLRKHFDPEKVVDYSYFNSLVEDAKDTISQFIPFDVFIGETPEFMYIPESSEETVELPFE